MLQDFYTSFHPAVEETLEKKNKAKGVRVLGTHPETGETIIVKMGRYGPVVQAGDPEKGEKPKFASLQKDQLMETITLEEALKLFSLPRTLGQLEGDDVTVGTGKFGPYVRYRNKYYSLKKNVDDPYIITLERAIEIIREKDKADQQKVIKEFNEIRILNGRYGPYISFKGQNYRIPKGKDPAGLSEEECLDIINKNPKKDK